MSFPPTRLSANAQPSRQRLDCARFSAAFGVSEILKLGLPAEASTQVEAEVDHLTLVINPGHSLSH